MARYHKSERTKAEIFRVASKMILEQGYTQTTAKKIAGTLNISTGNMTFYYPTKEHLMAELVDLCCRYQQEMTEQITAEWGSPVMAICLELASMIAVCEESEAARDFYLSAYTAPALLQIIRKNDARRASRVFRDFCPRWGEQEFAVGEMLVSGIVYGAMTDSNLPLRDRIEGALRGVLTVYQVPKQKQDALTAPVLAMDYGQVGREMYRGFCEYVAQTAAWHTKFID